MSIESQREVANGGTGTVVQFVLGRPSRPQLSNL